MTTDRDTSSVTRALAARTGTEAEDWFLVFKARYGMEVVFRALRDVRGPGDVVTQVFTCSTAVDPILVAGLTPVYGEVSPASISLDPDRVPVGDDARALVVQHTFGIVDHTRAVRLRDAAAAVGAVLVEDSAHCVGELARDGAGRPVADVSVHSFGVEKVLPTRFGGAIWVNPQMRDTEVRDRLVTNLRALKVVGRRLDLVARVNRSQVRLLNRVPGGGAVRDLLARVGAFEPPIAPAERRGTLPYPAMRPSRWMVEQVARQLPDLADIEARRREVVATYVRELADVVEVPAAIGEERSLVRFPFFAADAAAAQRLSAAVDAAGAQAGRWYRPALFPGVDDPAAYGYHPGDGALATTEDLIARVVNLPTNVTVERARELADVVRSSAS